MTRPDGMSLQERVLMEAAGTCLDVSPQIQVSAEPAAWHRGETSVCGESRALLRQFLCPLVSNSSTPSTLAGLHEPKWSDMPLPVAGQGRCHLWRSA